VILLVPVLVSVQLVVFPIMVLVAGIAVAVVRVLGFAVVEWVLGLIKTRSLPPICVSVLVPIMQTLRRSPAIMASAGRYRLATSQRNPTVFSGA